MSVNLLNADIDKVAGYAYSGFQLEAFPKWGRRKDCNSYRRNPQQGISVLEALSIAHDSHHLRAEGSTRLGVYVSGLSRVSGLYPQGPWGCTSGIWDFFGLPKDNIGSYKGNMKAILGKLLKCTTLGVQPRNF